MTWLLIVGAIWLMFRAGRLLWRAYVHPAHVLGRQAANMNWIASRTIKDSDGMRNTCVARDGMEAMISYKPAMVVLLKPRHPTPFPDFIAVERWLATSDHNRRTDFYRAVEDWVRSKGWYERLLELQGTDSEFCSASFDLYTAAFDTDQDVPLAGALLMEGVNRYPQSRDLAIAFIGAVERNWRAAHASTASTARSDS
jgi:hypothetical protein